VTNFVRVFPLIDSQVKDVWKQGAQVSIRVNPSIFAAVASENWQEPNEQ
jgi:predicted phosphoadenosine phosphosulfate sulfurtransferase